MNAASGGFEQLPMLFLTGLVAMTRMLAAMSVFPLFVKEFVPAAVRAVAAVAFTMIEAQVLWPAAPTFTASAFSIVIITKEAMIGVLIGFSFGLIFWAMEQVGHFIDFQSGLTFSQIVDPLLGNQTSVHARLTLQLFAVFFLLIGGMRIFLEMIYRSYTIWPILEFFPTVKPQWLHVFSDQAGLLLSMSLLFAAPVLIVLVVVELGFGLFNRAAPNFNVFDVTRPIKAWLASAILLLSLTFILERAVQVVGNYRDVLRVLQRIM